MCVGENPTSFRCGRCQVIKKNSNYLTETDKWLYDLEVAKKFSNDNEATHYIEENLPDGIYIIEKIITVKTKE